MSQSKADEWAHADKGSPWKHATGGGIRRDDGGGILDPSDVGPIGITPTARTENPQQQQAIHNYDRQTPEKLQETLARLGGPSSQQGAIVARVLQQKQMQPQPSQFKRGGGMAKRDAGGMMSSSQSSPWWTRSEARGAETSGGGFLHGTSGGRADKVETSAPGGSYVLPADIIAGLGEGNGLAGARVTQEQLSTGPRGIPLPRAGGGRGSPHPPAPIREAKGGTIPIYPEQRRASGGVNGQSETPVLLSHGEFVCTPDECVRIGRGLHKFFLSPAGDKILRADRMKGLLEAMDHDADRKRGHRILDAFVLHKRGEQVKKIASLPPPVKT